MKKEHDEHFLDLLTKKALYGLDEAEEQQLENIDPQTAESELRTLEMTAAAIGIAGISKIEPMPSHLRARILADSHDHVGLLDTLYNEPWSLTEAKTDEKARTFSSWFGWLGWAVAAAASVVLVMNVSLDRLGTSSISPRAALTTPVPMPEQPTLAQLRDQLASTPGVIKAEWAPGNVKDLKDVSGDVVWSDEKQMGYMRFHGLPVNDAAATCYQLWIFDQTQDKSTPIDGGIFDVSSDGELIVPINAKLKAVKPEMFALTLERHGGVVVSKREKIAALAKVESRSA